MILEVCNFRRVSTEVALQGDTENNMYGKHTEKGRHPIQKMFIETYCERKIAWEREQNRMKIMVIIIIIEKKHMRHEKHNKLARRSKNQRYPSRSRSSGQDGGIGRNPFTSSHNQKEDNKQSKLKK